MATEKEVMYEPVEVLFRDLGFRVIVDSLGLQPFSTGKRRIPDVIGYRWQEDRVDAVAVECKKAKPPDGVLEAIEQTMCSMLFLDKCYIATPAGPDLSILPILGELGIGYIAVDGKDAHIIREPGQGRISLKDEVRHNEQLRPKLKALLVFEDFAGKIDRKDMRGDWWWLALNIVSKVEVQQNMWASPDERCIFSGINFEKKDPLINAARNITRKRLADFVDVIKHLPRGYRIRLKEVTRGGGEELLTQDTVKYTSEKARKLLRTVELIHAHKGWRPELSIHRRLWGLTEDLTRDEGRRRLAEVSKDISPVVEILRWATSKAQ